MLDPAHTYEHHGLTVKIHYDEDARNPRTEFDNLGTIVGWANHRYCLSDRQLNVAGRTPAEIVAELQEDDARLILPFWYSPQGGLSLGEAGDEEGIEDGDGVICVTAEGLRGEYDTTRISAKAIERATTVVRGEVDEYSAYLRGDVYGFAVLDADGEHLDSCWGFYERDYCEARATEAAEYQAEQVAAEAREAYELACRGIQTVPR